MHLWALLHILYALNIEMFWMPSNVWCLLQRVHFRTFSFLFSPPLLTRRYQHMHHGFIQFFFLHVLHHLLTRFSWQLKEGMKKKKNRGRDCVVAAIAFWMRIQWLWMSIIHGNNRNNYLFNIHESIEREKKTNNEQSVQIYRKTGNERRNEVLVSLFFYEILENVYLWTSFTTYTNTHTHTRSGVFVRVLLFSLLFSLLALLIYVVPIFSIEKKRCHNIHFLNRNRKIASYP